MADSRVRDYFSGQAQRYQEASTSGLWDWWRRRECRAVLATLRPRPGERILDAGSGAGYYSAALAAHGAHVIAADLSCPMAREASRRLGIPAVVADLEHPPFRQPFDAVLCAGALEFCPRPARVIHALAKLLRPGGGRFVAMLPAGGIGGRLYRRFHSRHGLSIQLFAKPRIRAMAGRAHLELETLQRIGFNYVVCMRRNAP